MMIAVRNSTGATSSRNRLGLTLLELLIVMGILGVMLGAGVGAFTGLDPGRRTALSTVTSTLRLARNEALARRAGARVRFDLATGAMHATGFRVVGTWRFEGMGQVNGFGPLAEIVGGELPFTNAGYMGRALDFSQGHPSARLEVAVQDDPGCDWGEGFDLGFALRPVAMTSARLADLGSSAGLDMRSDGGLIGWFIGQSSMEGNRQVKGERIRLETPAGVLAVGRWSRVRMSHDGRFFRLYVGEVEVARSFQEGRLWRGPSALIIGGGPGGLPAMVDDLTLAVAGNSFHAFLPGGVSFAKETPKEILFSPSGALDPVAHNAPLQIKLDFEDGLSEQIYVGLYGTVEQ